MMQGHALQAQFAAAAPAGPQVTPTVAALERLDRMVAHSAMLREQLTTLLANLTGPQPENAASNVSKMDPRTEPQGLLPRLHAYLDMIEANLNAAGQKLSAISQL